MGSDISRTGSIAKFLSVNLDMFLRQTKKKKKKKKGKGAASARSAIPLLRVTTTETLLSDFEIISILMRSVAST